MTGSKPIGVLIDELHVMGSIHYAARVVGQIRGALELKKNSFRSPWLIGPALR